MSEGDDDSHPDVGVEVLREGWGWYLALGIALAALGLFAVSSAFVATVASVRLLGWALIVGGVLQAGHAFWRRRWKGFFLDLATGILYFVVGVMAAAHPLRSAVAFTLVIAALLMVGGVLRIVSAAATRDARWPWLTLNGLVALVLGGMVWAQWPISGLWVLGAFVGIDLILNGASLAALALAARKLPRPEGPAGAARERPEAAAPLGAHPAR